MIDPADIVSLAVADRLRRVPQPATVQPMLATLTKERFDDPDWIYERKFDGERVIALRSHGTTTLMSRTGHDIGASYPEIVEAFDAQDDDEYIIDGEVVAFAGRHMSFEWLAARMHVKSAEQALVTGVPVFYYVFDILHLNGYDLTCLPLRERKRLLRRVVDYSRARRIRFTPHRNERGVGYYEEICPKGWEGLIAKDGASEYVHGRSRSWLKFKCVNEQEFVIGGFTDPQGSRNGFGALLLGYYEGGALRYAGKVGTGYNEDTLKRLHGKLARMERKTSPFAEDPGVRHVHWVAPKVVAEVGFAEWTLSGHLRHPRFLGERRDKDPRDVIRERA